MKSTVPKMPAAPKKSQNGEDLFVNKLDESLLSQKVKLN